MSYEYICPTCGREFPYWYWGVTGKAGGIGTVMKPGLAAANFKRHKRACRRKAREARERKTTSLPAASVVGYGE